LGLSARASSSVSISTGRDRIAPTRCMVARATLRDATNESAPQTMPTSQSSPIPRSPFENSFNG
jgi:hypothetical protein